MPKDNRAKKPIVSQEIRGKLGKYVPAIIVGLNVVLVLADILLLSLIPQQTEDAVTARSESLAHNLQAQSAQKLAVDLKSTQEHKEKIFRTLPGKSRLLEVIRELESLRQIVSVRNFSFESEIPQKDLHGMSFLPLTIDLEGSLQQTTAALARLKQSPFLFTIEQTIVESPEGLSQTVRVKAIMRLYVIEPFNQN